MLNLFSNASLNQPPPNGIVESGAPITGVDGAEIEVNGISFTELLNAESSTVDMLEELKTLLSAEDFATLEGMLAEGQTLPLAEIVATLRQSISGFGMEQAPPTALKLSDVIPDLLPETGESAGSTAGQTVASLATEAVDSIVEQPATEVIAIDSATEQPVAGIIGSVAEQPVAETIDSATEQPTIPLIAGQTIVPITIGKVTIPVSIAIDQTIAKQVANKNTAQPVTTGQVAIPSAVNGDTSELSSNLGNSSSNSDQQAAAERFRMTEAMAAQIAQKTPVNNLFRTTEAGLSAINNMAVAPGSGLQSTVQTVALSQTNALPIHIPMGGKGWDQAVGERMLWMVGRQVQGAEVRITPPQLGPIDIRITIQNDQANVTFAAQHGVVREALEASIPRLREMLGENNLQLVNVDVNQRNNSEQRASNFSNQSSSGEQGTESHELEDDEGIKNNVLTMQSDGLVDDFA